MNIDKVLKSNNMGDLRLAVDRLRFKLQVNYGVHLEEIPELISINWLKFHLSWLYNRLNRERSSKV